MIPSYPDAAAARFEDGFLRDGGRGPRLYWRSYAPPRARGTVAVVPGGGDHSGRYPALTSGLVAAGFRTLLLDFRGHGRSDGRRWHVERFGDYLDDLDAFMAHVRARAEGGKVFVAGHSMGGLIAATWALAPGREAAGYVLSSPYFKLKLDPPRVKILTARLVGTVVPWLPVSTDLRVADLTTDEELQRWTLDDPLYGRATTPRWFVESGKAQRELMASAERFTAPLLVLAAGADPIADPEAARSFFDRAASKDKRFVRYDGLRHEIWNERERERTVGDAVAWLAERSA
ncbi:MAG TPA: alpha/beta hydrolase [Anaeromyxobacteraceae bacterium]|nr:alpha/beta hydrolase [Anaeromyxobacteraceae bacterium]